MIGCFRFSQVWLFCLHVCLSVCLFVCLSVCLPACPPACLPGFCVCLSVCMFVCLCVCLSVCLSVCMSVCLSGLKIISVHQVFGLMCAPFLANKQKIQMVGPFHKNINCRIKERLTLIAIVSRIPPACTKALWLIG